MMTPINPDQSFKLAETLRYLDHQANLCRGRDACEAFCLLLPPLRKQLGLPPMDDFEAEAFKYRLTQALREDLKERAA